MAVDVILGLQWGDEGKGKIVDLLAPEYDIVARFQGGPNAGHTIQFDNKKFILHTVPSGISSEKTINIIGNGVLIDPYIFRKEIMMLDSHSINARNNLFISRRAHLIVPSHRLLDAALELSRGALKIGSTLKGIGPAYTDKVARRGIRIGDVEHHDFHGKLKALENDHFRMIRSMGFEPTDFQIENMAYELYVAQWNESISVLEEFRFTDSELMINRSLSENKKVLAEGAQGTLLDIDFGSYPFVTSSSTSTGGVCTGLGIPPSSISRIFGIFKAYCTRVGSGPFPTELMNEDGDKIRSAGNEFGSTTGRPRRCGWIDLPALRYSIMINGVTDLIITKSDVLDTFETINACNSYLINGNNSTFPPFDMDRDNIQPLFSEHQGWKKDISEITDWNKLPDEFRQYISFIESELHKPVSVISTGPKRNQTIFRNPSFKSIQL
jgi:adenylosuccinate synthase